ncbi:MAG: S8 family serine peptidase, partial [Bacteroidota bacterium]
AKNVLTVGAVSETRSIWSSSSRGPVSDGRIKPEICGIGTKVYSTGRDYNYWAANGTSMAAPAVTGTLGLLYQRYRQLHNGDDPDGAFLKALVCNTADDLGNSGPDYTYGFGLINGRRAVEVMENLQYAKGEIEQGQVDQLSINVPAGVSEVKVMLYWSDKEAAAFPTKALVNDLDLSVQQPGGTVYFPWVLNPDTLHVEDVARRGVDNLNNIEQVTIETPTAGQYEIFVNGREIPFGPQAYYIVYDFIRPEITLTHPIGGEKWIPGTKELIQWDADDGVGQTYKIEYSADNGQNWATIVDNISHTTRFYEWTVPSLESSDVQLRVSRNGTALSASTKANFEIHSLPTNLTTTSYCNGLVEVGWTGTTEATDYEVLFYNGCDWEVVQSTNLTTALVDHSLQDNQEYWFTVRAVRGDGRAGERAQAVKCMVDPNALCPWGVAPNFNAFTIPDRGRSGTSSSLDLVKLFGEVRNVGQDTVFQYGFFFSVNGNTPVENTIQDTLLPGVTKTVDLGASIDFSATGVYSLEAWTRVEVDGLVYIDSLDTPHQVVQLPNPPIAFPYTLDLTQGQGSYQNDRIGLDGLDNVDFKTQGIGQLNFVNGSMSLASLEDDSQVAMDNEIILTMNVGNIPSNDERHVLINFRFASALDINTPLSKAMTNNHSSVSCPLAQMVSDSELDK